MAIPRRYVVLCVSALVSLFLLYQISRYRTDVQNPLPIASYEPPPTVDDGKLHWKDVPRRYPLQQLTPLPRGHAATLPKVQHKFKAESPAERNDRLDKRQAVKDAFTRCWQSYRTRAWMRDELAPISGGARNSFGGWAATLVDALDTLWIMDLKDDFVEAATAAAKVDFTTSTDETVNVFETTIRYLGGYLAAYDLSGDKNLLHKAVEVGEMLLVPFDTPNHMPITRWKWRDAADGVAQEAPKNMLVSELGSLSLEFTRLSQLTGDTRWYDAIDRITILFDSQQAKTKIPGLWPVVVNPKDMDLTGDSGFTLGGMADSLYEYFPKEFALLGGLSPVYRKLYLESMKPAIQHLFFRPMNPDDEDVLISGDARAAIDGSFVAPEPRGQHLGCFTGGMLGLGGRLFGDSQHVTIGEKLTKGCIWAYRAGSRGIMPEVAHYVPCEKDTACTWTREKWTAGVLRKSGLDESTHTVDDIIADKRLPPGFTDIGDRRYILRPEAIESVFIMYRITGDDFYREAAWDMFNAIQNVTRTEYANAAIIDITATPTSQLPPRDDRMESFWLAETLKYFYLIFSEPELISLDEYVLNTEAHPFKRPT